jgi:hypothetical protein
LKFVQFEFFKENGKEKENKKETKIEKEKERKLEQTGREPIKPIKTF